MATATHGSCEELLRAMIAFDTVNGHISGRADAERGLAEHLETQATGLGLATKRLEVDADRFNLLVSHRIADAAPWLLFESHLDTVSVDGMTIEPFAGRIADGRIQGRGACDTKGSGAAMLWALADSAASAGGPNNVAIVYTVDEEVTKAGVRTFVQRHLPALGWTPTGVIVGEPTGLRPVVAHNGAVRWTIRTQGVAAHSSDPARGRSAISMMVRVIDALESQYVPALDASHPLTGKAQCSINLIRGGVQPNMIPEQCEITLDRRVVPGEDPQQVLPAVEEVLDALRRDVPGLEVMQERAFIDPPLDPSGAERLVGFVQAVLTDMDLPAEAVGVAYGTDAANLCHAGVPAVVLGPGHIEQAHTCNEWLALEQLERAVAVYGNLMRRPLPAQERNGS